MLFINEPVFTILLGKCIYFQYHIVLFFMSVSVIGFLKVAGLLPLCWLACTCSRCAFVDTLACGYICMSTYAYVHTYLGVWLWASLFFSD